MSWSGGISDPSLQMNAKLSVWYSVVILFTSAAIIAFVWWTLRARVSESVHVRGVVVTTNEVLSMRSPVSGVIQESRVLPGSHFSEGDVLLTFQDESLKSRRGQIEARLESLRHQERYVDRQFEIKSNLLKKGLEPKISYLKFQEERYALKGQISETLALLESIETERQTLTVRAPFSGVVQNSGLTRKGVYVNEGQEIFTLIPDGEFEFAELQVDTQTIAKLKVGQVVELSINSESRARGELITGEIESIASHAQRSPGEAPRFVARVRFPRTSFSQHGVQPRSGMTLIGEIIMDRKTLAAYLLEPLRISLLSSFRE